MWFLRKKIPNKNTIVITAVWWGSIYSSQNPSGGTYSYHALNSDRVYKSEDVFSASFKESASFYYGIANPYGFIFSMLSHMISYLPFRKSILRSFFSFRIWGLEKKTVVSFLEFGFVVKAVQELNIWQIYVIEHRKKTRLFSIRFFFFQWNYVLLAYFFSRPTLLHVMAEK